nr:hypothetical protein [Gammaproteobacteria bacterium]
EGGYTLERVDTDPQKLDDGFIRQQRRNETNQFEFEKSLRCDRESYDKIHKLSPTRFRFRIIDAKGRDIRYPVDQYDQNPQVANGIAEPITAEYIINSTRVEYKQLAPEDSTRVEYELAFNNTSTLTLPHQQPYL